MKIKPSDLDDLRRMVEDPSTCGPNRGRESGYALRLLRAGYITRRHVSMREYFYHVTPAGQAAVRSTFYGGAAAARVNSAHDTTIESAVHCATRAAHFAHKS